MKTSKNISALGNTNESHCPKKMYRKQPKEDFVTVCHEVSCYEVWHSPLRFEIERHRWNSSIHASDIRGWQVTGESFLTHVAQLLKVFQALVNGYTDETDWREKVFTTPIYWLLLRLFRVAAGVRCQLTNEVWRWDSADMTFNQTRQRRHSRMVTTPELK
jgi:hypothetical protein